MSQSRRLFLKSGTMFGLSLAVAGKLEAVAFGQQSGGFTVPKSAQKDRLNKISREMFSSQVDTIFSFRVDGRKVNMPLIKVIESGAAITDKSGKKGDCFSVVFQGPFDKPLAQGTYVVQHEELGKFKLFIVPADTQSRLGLNYEAIINRLP